MERSSSSSSKVPATGISAAAAATTAAPLKEAFAEQLSAVPPNIMPAGAYLLPAARAMYAFKSQQGWQQQQWKGCAPGICVAAVWLWCRTGPVLPNSSKLQCFGAVPTSRRSEQFRPPVLLNSSNVYPPRQWEFKSLVRVIGRIIGRLTGSSARHTCGVQPNGRTVSGASPSAGVMVVICSVFSSRFWLTVPG